MKGMFLNSLRLNDFATFKNQEINFKNGLNVIVGETGSGKSLILDALQLILGHRADKKLVRKNCEFACIEAEFECTNKEISLYFEELGFPVTNEQIIIKRVIYKTGKTKSYINYQACNLTHLQFVAKRFIDLVGQFENQKLLSSSYQLKLIDDYYMNNKLLSKYQTLFTEYKNLNNKINSIRSKTVENEQKAEFLKFQIQQIMELSPTIEDEQQLLKSKEQYINAEKRIKAASQAYELLNSEESNDSAYGLIQKAIKIIEKDDSIFIDTLDTADLHNTLSIIEDYSYKLNHELNYEFNDEDLDFVINRLSDYQKIKSKFGSTIDVILEKLEQMKIDLNEIESTESQLQELTLTNTKNLKELKEIADELHQDRVIASKKLSIQLSKFINELNMKGALINIAVEKSSDLNENGFSIVTFNAQTNPGEGFYKIKDIASGGELSRILLAMRKVLAGHDSISIFLFDEIDTGIGGETALKIANALKDVSTNSQVIAISHLPQIASHADVLQIVDKSSQETKNEFRTYSTVTSLIGPQIIEFARDMAPIQ